MRFIVNSKKYGRKTVLIDDEDWEKVSKYTWSIHKHRQTFYVSTSITKGDGTNTKLRLHRFLMPGVRMVDHIDGNGLNNQKRNLRECTPRQNMQNQRVQERPKSSKYKGVNRNKVRGVWQVYINIPGKHLYVGAYTEEVDAAHAYNRAAQEHFGEFAKLNEVD
jgi:hypothetical protein